MNYAIEKTLLKPTAIDHSLSCCLTGDDHVNLVVSRATLLQVYRLHRSRYQVQSDETGAMEEQIGRRVDVAIERPLEVFDPGDPILRRAFQIVRARLDGSRRLDLGSGVGA